jgi:hypothetical protein
MANNHFLSSIYRIDQYDTKSTLGSGATMGVPHSFPSGLTKMYPVPYPGVTANGVEMASIIEMLPTGLNQPAHKYYTADSVSTLNTAAT